MKLEQQVCSLELAKKLKELGAKQESLFWWVKYKPTKEYHLWYSEVYAISGAFPTKQEVRRKKKQKQPDDIISAFTVAELGEMLPQIIKIKSIKYQLFCSVALDKQWFVVYANEEDYHDNAPIKFMMCHAEADARAKMLIYLLENKLIKL